MSGLHENEETSKSKQNYNKLCYAKNGTCTRTCKCTCTCIRFLHIVSLVEGREPIDRSQLGPLGSEW